MRLMNSGRRGNMEGNMSKPIAQFSGEDGNIFMLVGIACKALKGAGLSEDAKEMKKLALHANSYVRNSPRTKNSMSQGVC